MLTPDRVMVKRIKEYDKQLFVEWDEWDCRFKIYRKSDHMCGPTTPIMVVQNDDGSFRPLDMRVMQKLREADLWHNEDIIKNLDERNNEMDFKRRVALSDYVQQVAKEDLYNLPQFHGSSARGRVWRK